jgi:hypothetical protein
LISKKRRGGNWSGLLQITGFSIWDFGFGIWDLGFGIWDLNGDKKNHNASSLVDSVYSLTQSTQ